jgi:hypothetical protein
MKSTKTQDVLIYSKFMFNITLFPVKSMHETLSLYDFFKFSIAFTPSKFGWLPVLNLQLLWFALDVGWDYLLEDLMKEIEQELANEKDKDSKH